MPIPLRKKNAKQDEKALFGLTEHPEDGPSALDVSSLRLAFAAIVGCTGAATELGCPMQYDPDPPVEDEDQAHRDDEEEDGRAEK